MGMYPYKKIVGTFFSSKGLYQTLDVVKSEQGLIRMFSEATYAALVPGCGAKYVRSLTL